MLTFDNKLKESIYNKLNYEIINDSLIRKVYSQIYQKDSNNSYMFSKTKEPGKPDKDSKEDKEKLLIELFNINNKDLFKEKYKQAISGDGNEYRRITTLTSSSLCALLCFYNIKKYNITIGDVTYDDVLFEVKNKVIDPRYPSNMDIVLISNSDKKILFLESKFSEYMCHSKAKKISDNYLCFYNDLGLFGSGYEKKDNKKGTFDLEKGENNFYLDGIKQMISHYIGVQSFVKEGKSIGDRLELKDYTVTLGEIIFNAWDDEFDYFKNYKDEYSKLIKLFRDHNKNIKIEFLDEPLEYAIVFKDYHLDDKVRSFYFSKEKRSNQ